MSGALSFILPTGQFYRSLLLMRSEEHTSELQSQSNLVCRLLLEKKKFNNFPIHDRGRYLSLWVIIVPGFSQIISSLVLRITMTPIWRLLRYLYLSAILIDSIRSH